MFDFSKLKICLIAGTLAQGGAERQLYYIIKTLHEQGSEVKVLCLRQGEYWEEKIRDLGISVTWVGQSPFWLERLRRICLELQYDRPQIIQSQHFFTNLYSTFCARMLGIQEIGAIRNDGFLEIQNNRFWGNSSLRLPRYLVVNSKAAFKNLVKMGISPLKLFFLPNVIDLELFYPSTNKISNENICLLAIGNFRKEKRWDRFLKIIHSFRRKATEKFQVLLIGDGPERPAIQKQASVMGLDDCLKFEGQVSNPLPYYQKADILILTSDHEGTPNVILEAMACGLSVVATNVGGVEEIVQQRKTGLLVALSNEEGMVNALLELMENPHLRLNFGRRAMEYIVCERSLKLLPSFLASIYSHIQGVNV